jgi:phosphopantetheinyl transferase
MAVIFNDTHRGFQVGVWQILEDQADLESGMAYRSEAGNAERRLQQLASRKMLFLLAPELDLNRIAIAPSGKPIDRLNKVMFSISHTKGYAAAIACDGIHTGIDIELISERASRIAPRFLNASERKLIEQSHDDGICGIHTLCWSIKETVYKWWGRPRIDFARQIEITELKEQGIIEVSCKFDSIERTCGVTVKRFNNLWLTYMKEMH